MKKIMLFALLISVAGASAIAQGGYRGSQRSSGNGAIEGAKPGDFQFYLLTLSWSPEFCRQNPSTPECASHPRFLLHGLWPENGDGSYPADCSQQPGLRNWSAYKDLYPDEGLMQHEWSKHGTCSALSADAYFTAARNAVHSITIPPVLAGGDIPSQMIPSEILKDFAQANPGVPPGAFRMSCAANRLSAVTVCVSKDLKPISCQGVRTCGATSVKITPP